MKGNPVEHTIIISPPSKPPPELLARLAGKTQPSGGSFEIKEKGGNPMQTILAILGVAFLTALALRGCYITEPDQRERRVRRYVRQMDEMDKE